MGRQVIKREVPAELETSGDGRNIDLRIVPYGVKARVSDDGGRTFYDEVWDQGVFDKQTKAAHRIDVLMNFEHQQGIGGVVGRGVQLRDSEVGAEGTFRMLSGNDADKTLELVNEGVLRGVSLEAIAEKSVRDEEGVVHRIKATLRNIALCRSPAFPDAQVLAVREAQPDPEPEPEPEPEPSEPAPEPVLARPDPSEVEQALARVGYEPLLKRAVTSKPWDGSPARFTDDEYKRSCLIDRGGDAPVKERCSLPVLEPNGDVNTNALGAAAAALAGARGGVRNVSAEQKAAAARKLLRYYRMAEMDPPAMMMTMAGR